MTITITLVIVSDVVDVKPQHHRVIFMNRVVAVHRVTAGEVAEAEVDIYIVILAEPDDVLAPSLNQGWCVPVAAENLMLFEVNVDWVRPVKSALELPNLGRIAFYAEAHLITVEEFVINDPLSVIAVELETPLDPLSHSCRYLIERRVCRRIHTIVRDRVRDHAELKYFCTLSSGKNIVRWPSTVTLFQTILEVNDAACRER